MIDTLALTLMDYVVLPGFDFTLQPPSISTKTGKLGATYPLFRLNGSIITGSKAYHNSERFHVDIEPFSPDFPDLIVCRVHLSVPKFVTGSNYNLLGHSELNDVLSAKGLENELRAIGIATNIETATLSRLDLTRNVVCAERCATYAPLFQLLSMSRTTHADFGGTGHLWRNGQHQLAVYDKLAEMLNKKMETSGLPRNTLRFEYRLMRSRKLRATLLGMTTVADLKSGYDALAPAYEKALCKGIFRYQMPDRATFSFDAIVSDMKKFQDEPGYWFKRWKDAAFMELLISAGGLEGVETVMAAAAEVSSSRQVANKIRREMDALRVQAAVIKAVPQSSKKTYKDLFNELQDKVLLKAA